jgi:hypothetical protein
VRVPPPAEPRTPSLRGVMRAVIIAAVLTVLVACSSHPQQVKVVIYGSLRRNGAIVTGTGTAVLPNGAVVASTPTDSLGQFELVVSAGATYTIRGTTRDHAPCGPETIDLGPATQVRGPAPPTTALLSCASH